MVRFYIAAFVVVICRRGGTRDSQGVHKGKNKGTAFPKDPACGPFVTFLFPKDSKIPLRNPTKVISPCFKEFPCFATESTVRFN